MKKAMREALLDCFDLWIWEAATGSKTKRAWPEWERNGGDVKEEYGFCPICGYMDLINPLESSCFKCILNWKGGECTSSFSEYIKWCNSETEEERSKWALKISVLALERLMEKK